MGAKEIAQSNLFKRKLLSNSLAMMDSEFDVTELGFGSAR